MINDTLKIYLVDDNAMFRGVVRNYLNAMSDFEIVGEAGNGVEFFEKSDMAIIDVILMDINMPNMNGLEATKEITDRTNRVKVIGLSQYPDFEYMKGMIEAGANGYVVKTEMAIQLLDAINKVKNGKFYFPDL